MDVKAAWVVRKYDRRVLTSLKLANNDKIFFFKVLAGQINPEISFETQMTGFMSLFGHIMRKSSSLENSICPRHYRKEQADEQQQGGWSQSSH